ncbi:MAG: helix-turn-helix domain-containing protein [Patescibacteria group bacterium]|nr:helix-turn-helix domain-containing protein [Patescibacteria group bacterium]
MKQETHVQKRTKKRLEKLYQALLKSGEMANHQLRRVVRVSPATITRYMDELERQGRVRQINSKRHARYKIVLEDKV